MTGIDKSYRIGRCNHCPQRTVYAWKADTGLRLDDVRCPRCGSMLDRTSREARYIVRLTDEQIVEQRAKAIEHKTIRIEEMVECAKAWRDEIDLKVFAEGSADEYRCILNAESYERSVASMQAELKRLAKAHFRAVQS